MPRSPKPKAVPAQPETALRIHALLHTMRVIQQHEDRFCTIMHAIQRSGKVSAADRRELNALLDRMPGDSFQHDLAALKDSLPTRPDPPPARTRKADSAHAH